MPSSSQSGSTPGIAGTLLNWAGQLAANAAVAVTTKIVASAIAATIYRVRPDLSTNQQSLLRTYLESALTSFFNRRTNIRQQIRGILSIVCYEVPEENRERLIQQLREILRLFDWHGCLDDEPEPVVYGDNIDNDIDGADPNYDILVHQLKISPVFVDGIPRSVRLALVAELTRTPPPTCSITLDEVIDERGRIHSDVVALIQKVQSGEQRNQFHVFLYKRSALEHWFEVGGDVNPLTRERIHRSSQLFTLS